MFDFGGTFNKSQLDRLASFVREHAHEAEAFVAHLEAELSRVGILSVIYDAAGNPIGYKASPTNSYIGRLVGAYEVMGGDVLHDLQVRPMGSPVFLVAGDEVSDPKILSNGEPVPERVLADAPSSKLVASIKRFSAGPIARRDYLERKVRRTIDYADQLLEQIAVLRSMAGGSEDEASLEGLVQAVNLLISDKTYRAIADDQGRDPYGKLSRAPFTSYDPGPDRTAPEGVGVERGEAGYIVYGATEGNSS